MDIELWYTIYTCFIVGGFVIPVLNVLGGILGGFLDLGADADANIDVDLDVDADLDAGGDLPSAGHSAGHVKVPVNFMTLSLGAVVFGAVGRLCLTQELPLWAGLLLGVQAGVLGGYLIGRFVILPLKRNRAYALGIRDMRGAEGVVTLELRDDFTGTVELLSATGSQVTYSARPAEGIDRIGRGERVSVVGVDTEKMVCVVRPLDK